jgi:CubicO group peptidase (beta-lactamase class C family)
VAGAVAEAHTGKAWENLIREQVFAPLGITHAGFGAPGTSGACDQPRGHREIEGQLTPLDPADPDSDNPPALGPAGTINISLEDWALFAQDQLDGVHGHGKLLQAESYRKLHTPVVGNYALGWGVKLDADGTPMILTHSGSNGYWLADIRIWPKHNIIVLLAMNAGNEAAEEASGSIRKALSDRLKPFD